MVRFLATRLRPRLVSRIIVQRADLQALCGDEGHDLLANCCGSCVEARPALDNHAADLTDRVDLAERVDVPLCAQHRAVWRANPHHAAIGMVFIRCVVDHESDLKGDLSRVDVRAVGSEAWAVLGQSRQSMDQSPVVTVTRTSDSAVVSASSGTRLISCCFRTRSIGRSFAALPIVLRRREGVAGHGVGHGSRARSLAPIACPSTL